MVAATPCPLILAAPAAFIAGVSQAARRGILIKGGGPLEALAHTHTVMFDKTGTLTVGGARLVAVEAAPGESADEVLRLAGSLEQASQHVVAKAIVAAAIGKGLKLDMPSAVRETMGSGVEGQIGGRAVKAGSHQLVYGSRRPDWAVRALRRAAWRSALSVFVSVDGRPIGALLLGDELRRETPRAIHALRSAARHRCHEPAHREIIHQAGLLARISDGLVPADADRYLIRDAQRVIESIEALVRIHNAQEEDIYEHAASV
jgi:P-type E1-E2 ATPase